MARIPQVRRWKVTFEYKPDRFIRYAVEYVDAPTKLLALWAAREQRHGSMLRDPDCVKETVGLVRQRPENPVAGNAQWHANAHGVSLKAWERR